MKTIKNMMDVASKVGYTIVKNGVDDFELHENGVIIDFTKPLRIHREIPDLAPNKAYNGVPISLCVNALYVYDFNVELWVYLMNKQDGDIIHFDEILNLKTQWCDSNEDIVKSFDNLVFMGFVKDSDEYIDVYAYPQEKTILPFKYKTEKNMKRFAPFKFHR